MRGPYPIIGWFSLLSALFSQPIYGQADSIAPRRAHSVRSVLPEYDQIVTRYGIHNELFVVQLVQKNGVLIRSDSFRMLSGVSASGFPLDSASRMSQQGPTRIMYPDGGLHVACEYKRGRLDGPFIAYDEEGILKRRDYYRKGRLVHSRCYTPAGAVQPCQAFYQQAKFVGQWSEVEAYMGQKLDSLVDGERVWRIRARLKINALGQLAAISVGVDGLTSMAPQLPQLRDYVGQLIWGLAGRAGGGLSWQPAVLDGRANGSICILMLFRSNGVVECRLSYE